uniref:C-type lectin domain-containing protein n=1 Tax=Acrobeloides nanus TaxID=290746 RepID=A0A914CPR9_9BILA
MLTGCFFEDNTCIAPLYTRPVALVSFAASVNYPTFTFDDLNDLIEEVDFLAKGTLITVNFNPSDKNLTDFLAYATFNDWVNATMYNYVSTRASLTRDLEWALTQANCYCQADGDLVIYYDTTNNRFTKTSECIFVGQFSGSLDEPNDVIDMCKDNDTFYEYTIPGFILSKDKAKFIDYNTGVFGNIEEPEFSYPFFTGLHKNKQNVWSWYDYDLNEFPLTGFNAWGTGYPKGNASCAYVDFDYNLNQNAGVWKNTGCDNSDLIDQILCQAKACDASYSTCCGSCQNQNFSEKQKQSILKKRETRKSAMKKRRLNRKKNFV